MAQDKILSCMLIFFGGGTGCVIRHLTNLEGYHPFMPANIAACLIIGSLYCLTRHGLFSNPYLQSFVTVGLLGGLSTFTPIATFALLEGNDSFLMSCALFMLYMLIFFALSLAGYFPTALYCRRALKTRLMIRTEDSTREKKRPRGRQNAEDETRRSW